MQPGICMLSHLLPAELWLLSEEPFFLPWPQMAWGGEGEDTFMAHYMVKSGTKLLLKIASPWCWGWSPQDAQQSPKGGPGEEPHLWQPSVEPLEEVLGGSAENQVVLELWAGKNYLLSTAGTGSSHILLQSSTEETSTSRNLAQNSLYYGGVQHWRKFCPWRDLWLRQNGHNCIPLVAHLAVDHAYPTRHCFCFAVI